MLDELARPTVPVAREFYGRARDLRRKVAAEDPLFDATIRSLLAPLRLRLQRYPLRPPRQEALADVITGWLNMPCRDWRLSCDAQLDKGRAALTERRLVAGKLRPNDPDRADEDDVAALAITLAIGKGTISLHNRCLATFSLHALARRLQRASDGSVEALLHDIDVAAQAACGALTAGAGYRIATHEDGGGWRGRGMRQRQPSGDVQTVLSVRTWL